MQNKLLLLFACFAFFAGSLKAQDVITKQNGEAITVQITEVSADIVKYKKIENLTGPDYSISAADIFVIKYENGSRDIFEKNPATGKIQIRHVEAENKPQQPVQDKTPDTPAPAPVPEPKQASEPKGVTDELPVPAEGETLYEGTAVFPNIDVQDFRVVFLLSADNNTIHSWKIIYKKLKIGGNSIDGVISGVSRFTVGKDTTYLDMGYTKILGLTFVNGGATAKIRHKYVGTDYSSSYSYNNKTEVDFGTTDIIFKILKGKGPAISSQVKQASNGTFEMLGFDDNSVSFRAVVETPFYMASLSSGDRTLKASSIRNTKGNIHIGTGATATQGSQLLLGGNSQNLRLPKNTEVQCEFENVPAGFIPKTITLLTDEKAAPMSYNIASSEWIKPKQIGAGTISQGSPSPEPYSAQSGEYDVVELLENNIIEVEISGNDITQVNVKIRRLVPYTVNARIPVGSFFVSENPSAQNMVATAEKKVRLTTGGWQNISVPAACANRPKDIPGSSDKFSVQQSPNQDELVKLMPALNKANVSTPVKQAAVWIITDNADFDDLGILTSGPTNTRAIWYETTAHAMKICADAGIDITKKRIWNDKETIISKLSAGELKNWLKSFDKPETESVETVQTPSKPTPVAGGTAKVQFEQTTYSVYLGKIAKDDDGTITVELYGDGIGGTIMMRNSKMIIPVSMQILAGGKTVEYENCVVDNKCFLYRFKTSVMPTQIIVYGNDNTNSLTATFDAKTKKVIKN
ncbi:MAG: hypothetical protein LBS43_08350 [Prevotellaceae bacterium]|jgi:hypothetical protein|nr:hypothetical protein [Prevotellaceae bacterium]